MVPPVNVIQQQLPTAPHSASAGQILAQISRHSNPDQVSGTTWASGTTRTSFTPQVVFVFFLQTIYMGIPSTKWA